MLGLKHFSTFYLHQNVSIHKTFYSSDTHSLRFVNYLADYQCTSKGETTNAVTPFVTTARSSIIVVLVEESYILPFKSGFIYKHSKTILKIEFQEFNSRFYISAVYRTFKSAWKNFYYFAMSSLCNKNFQAL